MAESKIFILSAEARDEGGVCVLRYWGVGEEGPAVIEITPHRPVFFVSRHSPHSPQYADERRSLELTDFEGAPVDGLYFSTLSGFREAGKRLTEDGVRTYESDVRPEDRWLMERFITGAISVSEGDVRRRGNITVWRNPRFTLSDWRPRLSTLSLDIETGRDGRLYSVAVHYDGPDGDLRRVAVLAGENGESDGLTSIDSERGLIEFLLKTVKETDPDLLIGWYVIGFDLDFLDNKSRSLGLSLNLGRGRRPLRLVKRQGFRTLAELEGRLVIDGPNALRVAFQRFSDWRLETVARELLGRGKDIESSGAQKVEEIERRFREDKESLARYNLDDAVLVTEIFHKTRVLDQLITRSLITGLPPDQVYRSVAAFDRFFLPRLHRKGFVAPNAGRTGDGSPGAMVFNAGKGLFEDVAVLDFKSLYPTVIRTFHVDPYSRLKAAEHPLETPVGIRFSRSEHILPSFLAELMKRRAEAKTAEDPHLTQAVKILMNSMYGVMGSPDCRFYHRDLPTAITGIGRWVLQTTTDRLRGWGYEVLYGDTDSVFVRLKQEERQDPDAAGNRLAHRVDDFFNDLIRRDYGVTSRLELEYEKRYLRLLLPAMRGTGEGAVKRYAGLLTDGSVEIKGMEFVRSDSTPLAREFQLELLKRFFAGEDLTPWIRDVLTRLRNGELDDKLVYRRRLTRSAAEYKKNTPPHVRAVKMLDPDGRKDLREVSYVMTPAGPHPLELDPAEIDYTHYIEKQLRPLVNDVLPLIGGNFDTVLGGRQLSLFEEE